jgi:hypothetical protein
MIKGDYLVRATVWSPLGCALSLGVLNDEHQIFLLKGPAANLTDI